MGLSCWGHVSFLGKFYIIKFTVAGAPVDFGNSRMLQNLIKEEMFNPINVVYGVPMPTWVLKQWVRVMTLTP